MSVVEPETDTTRGGLLSRRWATAMLVVGLWLVAAAAAAEMTARVRDWFHSDEILYERLAIAVARTHSLVPRIHGVDIHSYSQLYPMLIAPAFGHGLVPTDFAWAQQLNALLMTSASVPAFLLARRVTQSRRAAYLAAVLSVCMPWILYASTLLTEVVAYPVFLWTLLAFQRATAAPSWRNDLLAVLSVPLAYAARTELIVLVVALPLAITVYELGHGPRRLGRVVRTHPLLAVSYVLLAAAATGIAAAGHITRVTGLYVAYATRAGVLPSGFFGGVAEHLATFSLAFGVLPLVIGTAWLLANAVRRDASDDQHAFACVGSVSATVILLQAVHFDVSEVGYVYDRYLLYLSPIVVLGTLCAVLDPRPPRWSLLVPGALVACGFAFGAIPRTTWAQFAQLLPDAPVSALYRPLAHAFGGLTGARVALVVGTVSGTALFAVAAPRLVPRRTVAALAGFLALALATTTSYVLVRYFGVDDWSERPLTNPGSGALDRVDRTVGTAPDVTMAPYPVWSTWFASQRAWRDYEFWNKSVVRNVEYPGMFSYTGIHFHKLVLDFDPSSGPRACRRRATSSRQTPSPASPCREPSSRTPPASGSSTRAPPGAPTGSRSASTTTAGRDPA